MFDDVLIEILALGQAGKQANNSGRVENFLHKDCLNVTFVP